MISNLPEEVAQTLLGCRATKKLRISLKIFQRSLCWGRNADHAASIGRTFTPCHRELSKSTTSGGE